jgi:peptidoglycan/LPS O-acetylase OafA/YrhL
MVSVTVLLSVVIASPLGAQQVTAQTAMGAMLLVANIVIARTTGGYFDAAAETNPLLNTWSLSVEEQFYLVFPLVLLLGWVLRRRVPRGRALPVLLVAVVAVASFGLMMLTSRGGQVPFIPGDLVGFYGPLSRAWEFAAGALLALVVGGAGAGASAGRRAWRLGLPPGWVGGLLGAAMLGASLWLIDESVPVPGLRNLLPVIGTVLILHAGVHRTSPVSRVLATRPFVALGDVSYSWYLWHWPLIVFAVLLWPDRPLVPVAAAIVSLLPSIASYHWVEQPIRQATGMTRGRWARLLTVTLIPPLACSSILLQAADAGYWNPTIQRYSEAVLDQHAGQIWGCFGEYGEQAVPQDCTWNARASGSPIYLLGDSKADQLSEAVMGAAFVLNRPVHIYTYSACPPIPIFLTVMGDDYVDCRDYVERALEWVSDQPPGLIVMSWLADYATDARLLKVGSSWENGSVDPVVKSQYMEEAIRAEIITLQSLGSSILLVQDSPVMAWNETCSLLSILKDKCFPESRPRQESDDNQRLNRELIDRLGSGNPSVKVLDLADHLCPQDLCEFQRDGIVLYRSSHLTVAASRALADVMKEVIEDSP